MPLVTSVVTDGSDVVVVNFNQPVTWDSVNASTFHPNFDPGAWINQLSATSMEWFSGTSTNHNPGEAWDWTGSDPDLAPSPDASQTGTTS